MQRVHEKHLNTCHETHLVHCDAATRRHLYLLLSISHQFKTHKFRSLFIHNHFQFIHNHNNNMATEAHNYPAHLFYGSRHHQQQQQHHHQDQARSTQVVKATTAVVAGGSLLILAGLLLVGTVIGLTAITPLLVIFSPVLVPAVIAVALLGLGFLASGSFGVAAVTVLTWIYKYVTGKHPPGADQLDTARHKLMNKAREIKDYGQQHVTGTHASS
ncbi:Oleosin 1-like [Stylosanthes scabra]|uniref:Oleosin 1-like n=1 Tax=Stylosanthes scabra TaxID=79078 RepID=A0ABU6W430_9FABA|nr:Oleosin 1-like [Stylosanthes scabra]